MKGYVVLILFKKTAYKNMMNGNPLVSVIIPVFMAADYIEKSILSVINQTYKNVEVICIDDASADASYKICTRLSRIYPNIRVLYHMDKNGNRLTRNLGQEKTRNIGLDLAKGKYFMFLDADDSIQETTVEELVDAAEKSDAQITMAAFSMIIDGRDQPCYANIEEGLYTRRQFAKKILNNISWENMSCIGAKLYRTEFIKRNNIVFDDQYKHNEDCAFFLCSLMVSDKIYYVNKPFYKYLIRDELSVMSSYRKYMFTTNARVIDLLYDLFNDLNILEKKKNDLYVQYSNLFISSLINEIRFSNKENFFVCAEEIRNYEKFPDVLLNCIEGKFLSKHAIILKMLNERKYQALFLLFQVRQVLFDRSIMLKIYLKLTNRFINKRYLKNDSKNVKILMFHNISEKDTSEKYYVSNYRSFYELIKRMQEKTRIVSINELNDTISNAVVLTFDDGYEGVYLYAYPFLKKNKIPFTIFVVIDYVGKTGYLSEEQLIEMAADPLCSIGAHSISHNNLRNSRNIEDEIAGSKEKLQDIIGSKVEYFAYPYGSIFACDRRSIRTVKKAGYKMAFSTIQTGVNARALNDKFFVPRINGDVLVREIEK